jgi:hypothetical protein
LNVQHPQYWVRFEEHQEPSVSTTVGKAVDDFDGPRFSVR